MVRYPHVSASRRGLDYGPIDDQLREAGLSRRVTSVVPNYAAAVLMALQPNLISIAPRVLAEDLVQRGMPVRWHDYPLALPQVDVDLRWHRRLDEDAASRWLRNHIRAAVKPLTMGLARRTHGSVPPTGFEPVLPP